jgi:hypothetical protein
LELSLDQVQELIEELPPEATKRLGKVFAHNAGLGPRLGKNRDRKSKTRSQWNELLTGCGQQTRNDS